ncbi:BadF/BadG/BcrA/BcrD ATPase family protein [Cognatiyoonia sp. IB215446]|uniref:BadF/BadG/BcrA/BcrD ATPase family protein n=1 Tax=Cognatiyoonia sp. IB215446 TaxID=3097355 RepID=UPI002A0CCC39|nr:BadF/BadG/BcrA/BcrD ATPase family protein [Cognatiyoonia sp. IB215446]MDX8348308.1 BadF/BadG/BcrA/BcrD ATPase family protein [Cognatiyoonia sp. IB215446]
MHNAADQYVFGVDGGGSGCRVQVTDPTGKRLVVTEGGPANVYTDLDGALKNIRTAIKGAAAQLGLDDRHLTTCPAHLGLAGAISNVESDAVKVAIPFERLSVSDDRATTLAGALGDTDGIVASVGTGSFVAAQMGAQQRFFGGWGAMISDEASGAWLGYQLLTRSVFAADGLIAKTVLTKEMLTQVGGSPAGLTAMAKDAAPDDIAALAPRVVSAANQGDEVGVALMKEGANYLMACIRAAGWGPGTRLCLTGGIGPYYAPYLDADLQPFLEPPAGSALDGAVLLALRHVTQP